MTVASIQINNPSFSMDYDPNRIPYKQVGGETTDFTAIATRWLALDGENIDTFVPIISEVKTIYTDTKIEHILELPNHPFKDQVGENPIWMYISNMGAYTFCASEPQPQDPLGGPISYYNALTNTGGYNIYYPRDVKPMFTTTFTPTTNDNLNYNSFKVFKTSRSLIIIAQSLTPNGYPQMELALRISDAGFETRFRMSTSYQGSISYPAARLITYDTSLPSVVAEDILFFSKTGGSDSLYRDTWFKNIFKTHRIEGSISENLELNDFMIVLHAPDADVKLYGNLTLDTSVTNTYSFDFDDSALVNIICTPVTKLWEPNTAFVTGDVIVPEDTTTYPYYFEALNDGTSGDSQPAFNTLSGSQTNDNTIIWIRKDRIVRPQIHGPISSYEVV